MTAPIDPDRPWIISSAVRYAPVTTPTTTQDVTACNDCPWQGNDLWCKRVEPPTIAEINEVNRLYREDGDDAAFVKISGYTGPYDTTPEWCPLRSAPVLVALKVKP